MAQQAYFADEAGMIGMPRVVLTVVFQTPAQTSGTTGMMEETAAMVVIERNVGGLVF